MRNTNIYTSARNFFNDSIVYQTTDRWGDIVVIDHRHYRNLTFNSIYEQSSMDVHNPHILVHEYTRAMMMVLAFIKPHHATILGLGGGCLLRSLCQMLPTCELHAVELRQRVYDVASEFFGIPISKKVTITISDAKQQLKDTDDNSTNVIFADMYSAYHMNPFQMQKRFFDQCYRVLSSNGWLVINYHEIPLLNRSFLQYLHDLFAEVFVCVIPGGNSILYASKYRIDALYSFEEAVTVLEKKLGIKLIHLFKRLTRLE